MAIIRVDNVGLRGVIKDQTPWETPVEAWSSARNIRFAGNYAERIAGHSTAWALSTQNPTTIFYDRSSSTPYWYMLYTVSAATSGGILVYNGTGTTKDITRSTAMTSNAIDRWTGGILNGVPVFNSADDVPVYWGRDFTTPTRVANLPWVSGSTTWATVTIGGGTGIRAKVLRGAGPYYVALYPSYPTSGATTVAYPHTILWSHPADPGTVPVSWDYTDTTRDAGRKEVSESQGELVDMLSLGEGYMVYKTDAIIKMQLTGQPWIFTFNPVTLNTGLLSKDCVVEFKGKHFVVGFNDIVLHNGVDIESLVNLRVHREIFDQISLSTYKKSFCFNNRAKQEIWFCYPTTGNSYCNMAAIWNWNSNCWSFREMPNALAAALGAWDPQSGLSSTYATWAYSGISWDEMTRIWDTGAYGVGADSVIFSAQAAASTYLLDDQLPFGATTPTAYLEKNGIAFESQDKSGIVRVDPTTRKTLRHVWPRIDAAPGVVVSVYVGSQQFVDSGVEWSGPYSYTVGTTDKIDCLVQGRLLAIRFETTTNEAWRLHGYSLDISSTGKF